MSREHVAKSFKSGNSVAIRMPSALGVRPGREWTVVERDGELVVRERSSPKRKFNIDKVWGCAVGSGLQLIKDEDRIFEHRPLLWEDTEWRAKHMPE